MSSNLRVDQILPSTGTSVGIGSATGSVTLNGNLTVNGVLTYEDVTNVDSIGIVTARSDVSIADKIIHTGDTNTAIRFPAPDTFTVETGGAENARFTSSSITFKAPDGGSRYFFGEMGNSASAELSLYNSSDAQKVRIAANNASFFNGGNLGIGDASPQQKLDVVGSAHTVAVFRPDTNTVSAYGDASVVNNLVNLRMPYGSNPGSQTNNGARWGIKFQGRNDGNEYGTDAGKSASIYAVSEETNSGYNRKVGLSFYTSPFDSNQQERLRITSTGNIGINKSDPDAALVVYDPAGSLSSTKDLTAEFRRADGTYNPRLQIRHSTDGTDLHHTWSTNAGNFTFSNGGVERIRISSAGKVGIGTDDPKQFLSVVGRTTFDQRGDYYGAWINGDSGADSSFNVGAWYNVGGRLRDNGNHVVLESMNTSHYVQLQPSGGYVGINETGPDTTLHISRSASQNDTHGILKVESTNTATGAATNASLIAKNRYGWSQFMQWEEHGLRIGSRSTTTGGEGKVTVTYGADNTGAVINENGVVTMPQQCGFHVVMHATQSPNSNEMVYLWDTDASDSRSYIKNCTFNAGRFVAPVAGLYYFTSQLLLMNVASNDDNIHLSWTKGSSNSTFAYWNTRTDGQSANGYMGYGGYLPVTGSTTVYLAANEIFGIKISYSGDIDVYGTDANWGHWSGFLVG